MSMYEKDVNSAHMVAWCQTKKIQDITVKEIF
jgi:hypothetical protein